MGGHTDMTTDECGRTGRWKNRYEQSGMENPNLQSTVAESFAALTRKLRNIHVL